MNVESGGLIQVVGEPRLACGIAAALAPCTLVLPGQRVGWSEPSGLRVSGDRADLARPGRVVLSVPRADTRLHGTIVRHRWGHAFTRGHGDPVSVSVLESASRARRAQRLSGLAARTHPAGSTFRRLARRLRPRRIGLALGGGGAWGFAHVALIARLEEDGIPIDLITGCSMGAAIGGLYAAGGMAALEALVARRGRILPAMLASTLSTSALEGFLGRIVGDARLETLETPFYPTTVDLMTGEELAPLEGSLVEAITNSSRLPPLLSARRADGRALVDGAISAMVPVDAAYTAGADVVIACNVIPATVPGGSRLRDAFASISLLMHRFGESQSSRADLSFALGDPTVQMIDFHRAPEIIARAAALLPPGRLLLPDLAEAVAS